MSTCPSKNIHSLYIDGELPQPYKNSFEVHISECAKCAKQQQLYVAIDDGLHNSIFEEEKTQEQDHENGYLRLKARLSYKEIIAPEKACTFGAYMLKGAPIMAAALILALFLPLNLFYTDTKQNSMITNLTDFALPYNSVNAAPIQQQGIVIDASIPQTKFASMVSSGQPIGLDAPKLTEIDVFMPELLPETTQIQITLFRVSDMPMVLIAELHP